MGSQQQADEAVGDVRNQAAGELQPPKPEPHVASSVQSVTSNRINGTATRITAISCIPQYRTPVRRG
jgi:hypothetical protein